MSSGAKRCPIDGQRLPERSTGRPATFCSTGCRRAADNQVRILTREIERLEVRRNDALVSAAEGSPLGFTEEESHHSANCRTEAAALARRIKAVTRRLATLHEQLAQET